MSLEKTFITRIKKLQKKLDSNSIYLFSNESQISYFTGFKFLVHTEREAFFAVTKTSATLIYTSFSPVSTYENINYLPGTFPSQLQKNLETIIGQTNAKHIWFDADTLYVSELEHIRKIEYVAAKPMEKNLANKLMIIKDTQEIKAIKKACQISSTVFETVKNQIVFGMTEQDIAKRIEDEFKANGVTELAFPTIVAFGPASAKPHHQPSNTKLEKDMPILIDMGCKYNNYCSDMTRTFWFGDSPTDQFLKIETAVQEAYKLALETANKVRNKRKPLAKEVDNAARVFIANQGFGENFIHTTGHGLGLEIHESPSLSWQNNQPIEPGMIVTIEPGIYLEGEFGYRHENTILVTKNGAEVLTKSVI